MFVPTVEQLRDAFAYVAWADGQCVEVARSCPPAGLVAEQEISLGSVHKVLVHLLSSQETWLARFHGQSPTRMRDATDYPTVDAVADRWPAVHAGYRELIDAQTPATLAAATSYRTTQGQPFTFPLGQLLLHVADHATYHRGQLNSMAKRAGGTPRPIMRFTWMKELGGE